MNEIKVRELLKRWSVILEKGEYKSKEKANNNKDGLMGRIKRSNGKPVVFDFKTYGSQKEIQNILCQELPQWADIIRSIPEIMDGYHWTRKDFIELYFEHFRLVVEKLERIIDRPNVV